MDNLKVSFVIGSTASGKSTFIKQNFTDKNVEFLNVYDFQMKAFEEAGFQNKIPLREEIRCLFNANNNLLEAIVEKLQQGKNLVVEHTLLKSKRRITYIEAIRKAVGNVEIEFYVMQPSEEIYRERLEKRDLLKKYSFQFYKNMALDLEFPNVAEGFDRVYEVLDNSVIQLRIDPPKPELVELAHKELFEEAEQMKKETKTTADTTI